MAVEPGSTIDRHKRLCAAIPHTPGPPEGSTFREWGWADGSTPPAPTRSNGEHPARHLAPWPPQEAARTAAPPRRVSEPLSYLLSVFWAGCHLPFDKRTLVLPGGTTFGERVITTRGDVIVADGAAVDFGFETDGRAFIGERVTLGHRLNCGGDVRVDMWSRIHGDIETRASAYLGEKVEVKGKLRVGMDLDVGDDVKIEQGFEAHGWINIRNPIPLVMYVFFYLMQLLQMGKSEEVEKILKELEAGEETFTIGDVYLYVPEGSKIGLQQSKVPGHLDWADGVRVLGNYEASGDARLGKGARLYGALRSGGDVTLGDYVEVHGDLVCDGVLRVGDGCHVHGNVKAERVEMKSTATVDGTLNAPGGVRFVTPEVVAMRDKIEHFESSRVHGTADVLDLLG